MRDRAAASRAAVRWRRARFISVLFILAVGAVVSYSPGLAHAQPPGNNGFIKVDGEKLDDIPNNDPHVGCRFLVEFYNYDEGPLTAEVTFEGIPPTGGGVLLTDTVFIGEDPAGGGNDLDAAEKYTLDLSGIDPHPQQGFHVKLTIHAEGSQGADVKHKVFWVQDCEPRPTTPPPTTPPPTTPPPTTPPPTTSGPPPVTSTPPPPSGGVQTGGGSGPASMMPTLIGLFLLTVSFLLLRLRQRTSHP